jgi:3-hydroxyisobutyrate dehydrogenase-like beta-hydroxyacid dehydrogenase
MKISFIGAGNVAWHLSQALENAGNSVQEIFSRDPKKAKEYGITGGVVVRKINSSGALYDQTRMKDGFVILKVNDRDVNNVDEMRKIIGNEKSVTISGFYPGYDGLYEYPITLE